MSRNVFRSVASLPISADKYAEPLVPFLRGSDANHDKTLMSLPETLSTVFAALAQ